MPNVPTPSHLPPKPSDGDQIMDANGNIFEYNAEEDSWIYKGQLSDPDIVTEAVDGLMSPDIFNRLAQIQTQIKSGVSYQRTKLFTSVGSPYFFYFHSVDNLLSFTPEIAASGKKMLRIEVNRAQVVRRLLRFPCRGPKGPAGAMGDAGTDGTPAANEIFQDPESITSDAFEIRSTVPTPINTPISIRLFRDEVQEIEIKYDPTASDPIVEVTVIEGFEIDLIKTIFDYDEASELLTGTVFLQNGDFSDFTGEWQYKARQVGPDGDAGSNGLNILEVVDNSLNDDGIRYKEAVVSFRKAAANNNLFFLTTKLFENITVGDLRLNIPGRIDKIEDTVLTAVEFTSGVDGCSKFREGGRRVGLHKFDPQEFAPSLTLPQWTPTKKCDDTRRYEFSKLDWTSQTEPPIPLDIKLDPRPGVACCADSFYYCPNLGDACSVGGNMPFQVSKVPVPPEETSAPTEATAGSSEESSGASSASSGESSSEPGEIYIAIKNTSKNPDNPTGWEVADGTGGLPDLRAKYLRGAAVGAGGGTGGTREHEHNIDFTSVGIYSHGHVDAGDDDPGVDRAPLLCGPIVSAAPDPHTHGTTEDDDHAHDLPANKATDPAKHLPRGWVVDWIGKEMTESELAAFPGGTILGVPFATAVPNGWQACDGTNGTPNLLTRYARVAAAAVGGGGETTHDHESNAEVSSKDGAHFHGMDPSTDTISADPTGTSVASNGHDHTGATNTDPNHDHTVNYDVTPAKPNDPPHYDMPYIIKTSGTIVGSLPSTLITFFNPAMATPAGFSDSSVAGFLSGFSAGDADFGAHGMAFTIAHNHIFDGSILAALEAAHNHGGTSSLMGEVAVSLDGGINLAASSTHLHGINDSASDWNSHLHTLGGTTVGADHLPPYSFVKAIEKN